MFTQQDWEVQPEAVWQVHPVGWSERFAQLDSLTASSRRTGWEVCPTGLLQHQNKPLIYLSVHNNTFWWANFILFFSFSSLVPIWITRKKRKNMRNRQTVKRIMKQAIGMVHNFIQDIYFKIPNFSQLNFSRPSYCSAAQKLKLKVYVSSETNLVFSFLSTIVWPPFFFLSVWNPCAVYMHLLTFVMKFPNLLKLLPKMSFFPNLPGPEIGTSVFQNIPKFIEDCPKPRFNIITLSQPHGSCWG